jgi:hypothetical protein
MSLTSGVAGPFICLCPALRSHECTQQMGNFMATNGIVYPLIVPMSAIKINPLPTNKKISLLPVQLWKKPKLC